MDKQVMYVAVMHSAGSAARVLGMLCTPDDNQALDWCNDMSRKWYDDFMELVASGRKWNIENNVTFVPQFKVMGTPDGEWIPFADLSDMVIFANDEEEMFLIAMTTIGT